MWGDRVFDAAHKALRASRLGPLASLGGRVHPVASLLRAVGEALLDRDLAEVHGAHTERLLEILERMPRAQRLALGAAATAIELGHFDVAGVRFLKADRASRQAGLRRWEKSDSAVVRAAFQLVKMTAILGLRPDTGSSIEQRGTDAILEAAQ